TVNDDGSVTLTPDQLDGLTVTPPADSNDDFDLTVTATSTESSTGDTSTTSASISVDVVGVADTPPLEVSLGEGTPVGGEDPTGSLTIENAGDISAGYHNSYGYYTMDGEGNPVAGEVIWADIKDTVGDSFTIEGVEEGSIGFFLIPNGDNVNDGLSDGLDVTFEQNENGQWIPVGPDGEALSGQGAPALFSEPGLNPTGFDYMIDNQVTGNQNWEDLVNGGDQDFNDANFQTTFEQGDPGSPAATEFPLDITTNLVDTDGSETLSITVTDLPEGVVLSTGVVNDDGSVTLTTAELEGLTMTVPEGTEEFALTVTSTTTEDDGDTASVSASVSIEMDTTAEAPDLAATDAAGLEDNAIALDVSAALTDTDGSETLSITVSDIPEGAVLSAGTVNDDGSVTLTAAQLDGLTVTPPENSNEDFDLTITATSTESSTGDTATTTASLAVDVVGVADAPPLEISLGEGTPVGGGDPVDVSINSENVTDTGNGFTVMARSIGDDGELNDPSAESISLHTTYPQGFGVSGSASGADSELGYDNATGTSEEMIVAFDDDVSSVDVAFAWKHAGEDAVYELYQDGVKVGEGMIVGGSDGIDPAVTLAADNGSAFDQIVFSAPTSGDDYLINSISFETFEGGEGTVEYPLDIATSLVDADGSETLSITVDGLAEGVTLSAGTVNDNGSVTLTPAELDGLTMSVPDDAPTFDIGVSATTTENDGDTATVTASISVSAQDGVADDVELTATDATGLEDAAIALNIDAALTDTDGSETLSINVSGIPEGAVLSAGTLNDDGSVTLTPGQLEGLTITPAANSNDDFALNIAATSTETSSGDTSTTTTTMNVDVIGVADAGQAIAQDDA
ncbi:MAG: DUF4114 domain-containing protein, partial [Rhodospirillaceae bacterium]|nr:DUF4114 domain-containing protein [Rhodospirillaceae bacterium]